MQRIFAWIKALKAGLADLAAKGQLFVRGSGVTTRRHVAVRVVAARRRGKPLRRNLVRGSGMKQARTV
jgi:hypothetical protein